MLTDPPPIPRNGADIIVRGRRTNINFTYTFKFVWCSRWGVKKKNLPTHAHGRSGDFHVLMTSEIDLAYVGSFSRLDVVGQ